MASARQRNDAKGRRALVLERLLAGDTWEAAAQAAGVSVRSVRRYVAEPDFGQELTDRHDRRLVELSRLAVTRARRMLLAIEAIATNKRNDPNVRLRAARTWLDLTMRLYEGVDLAGRVAALEGGPAMDEEEEPEG